MKNYNYEYYRDAYKGKFTKLLNYKYKNEKSHKRRSKFVTEFEKKYSRNLSETIKNWYKTDQFRRTVASADLLVEICDFFQCDLDYFFTEQDEFCSTMQHASQYIGLDYETTDKISHYPTEIKELLNKLVLHSSKDNLLKILQSVQTYALEAQYSNVKLEVIGADLFETQDIEEKLIGATPELGNTLPDKSKRMLQHAAATAFNEVLSDTYDDYIEKGNELLQERINRNIAIEKKQWLRIKEKSKWGNLTPDEIGILYCGIIGNSIPTKDEAFEIIEKKGKHKYEMCKNRKKGD